MKKIFLLLLLIYSQAFPQEWNAEDFDRETKQEIDPAYSIDYDASTEFLSSTPTMRLTGKYPFREDFSDGNYNLGNVWTPASGTWVVDTLVTNPLSTNKWSLKCTGAGVISIPCNQAYGRWSFDLYKGAETNSIDLILGSIVSDRSANTGYYFRFGSTESIGFGKVAAGTATLLSGTGNAYFSNNSFIHVDIYRNTNGATSLYVNNALVSVVGGTGTNPSIDATYTSSNYFCIDADANDRISNIICEYGEGSLDLSGHEKIKFDFDRTAETNSMNWSALGTYSLAQSSVDKKSGTYSLAMTTAVGDATNCITLSSDYFTPLVAGEKYTYEFKARGTGVLGSELTTNGTMDSDTWWSKGSGCAISGGVANISTASSGYQLTSGNNATIGTTYKITYTLTVTSGNATAFCGSASGVNRTASGTYTDYIIATATSGLFRLYVPSAFVGTIDDVTVKAITLPTLTVQIGGQSKSFTNISCVPGTFTKCVWNFLATSNEVSQPIKLWANQADVIYTDDMSLTQAWDLLVNVWVKTNATGFLQVINKKLTGQVGFDVSLNTDKIYFRVGDGTSSDVGSSTIVINNNTYHLCSGIINRTGNIIEYVDGVLGQSTSISNVGKLNNSTPLSIGARNGANLWSGQIGEVLITKFTDISTSNVSASSLLSAYRNGLPSGWVGGTNVLRMKLKGSTASEMLKDYSGMNQTVTPTNIDLTDRARATYKSK